MSDRRVENLARVICEYSLQVKPGQLMLIQSPALAEPLVLELVKSALRLGANPRVLFDARVGHRNRPSRAISSPSP